MLVKASPGIRGKYLKQLIMEAKNLKCVFLSGTPMINNLYDTDYAQWTRSQIEALKAQDLKNIDFEHLIENLEMGDPKETVESNLIILIAHLLKLAVQKDAPDWMTNSWYNSIDEHRKRVLKAQ